jgi:hypothetical protein
MEKAVVGSDIAELLLKKKIDMVSESDVSATEGDDVVDESLNATFPVSPTDAKITQKFCDLLLFGHKNGALGNYQIQHNVFSQWN